jgi:hypothetical protein
MREWKIMPTIATKGGSCCSYPSLPPSTCRQPDELHKKKVGLEEGVGAERVHILVTL